MLISLKQIYDDDQKDRNKTNWDNDIEVEKVNKRDKLRIAMVIDILEIHKSLLAIDYYHASLVFQHGCKPSHYKKANELAKKSMEMGEEKAKWMYAASMDRWLLSTNKPQKFGTQFIQQKGKDWELSKPIDKTTSDKERAKYNVPPLSKALEIFLRNS